jgi:hypothetical protein
MTNQFARWAVDVGSLEVVKFIAAEVENCRTDHDADESTFTVEYVAAHDRPPCPRPSRERCAHWPAIAREIETPEAYLRPRPGRWRSSQCRYIESTRHRTDLRGLQSGFVYWRTQTETREPPSYPAACYQSGQLGAVALSQANNFDAVARRPAFSAAIPDLTKNDTFPIGAIVPTLSMAVSSERQSRIWATKIPKHAKANREGHNSVRRGCALCTADVVKALFGVLKKSALEKRFCSAPPSASKTHKSRQAFKRPAKPADAFCMSAVHRQGQNPLFSVCWDQGRGDTRGETMGYWTTRGLTRTSSIYRPGKNYQRISIAYLRKVWH